MEQFPAQLPCSWEGFIRISLGREWGIPRGFQVMRILETTSPSPYLFFVCVSSLLPHPKSRISACSSFCLLHLDHSQKVTTSIELQMLRCFALMICSIWTALGCLVKAIMVFHLDHYNSLRIVPPTNQFSIQWE